MANTTLDVFLEQEVETPIQCEAWGCGTPGSNRFIIMEVDVAFNLCHNHYVKWLDLWKRFRKQQEEVKS